MGPAVERLEVRRFRSVVRCRTSQRLAAARPPSPRGSPRTPLRGEPGTSFGATIPSRTLSPRISTTVITMSLLITIDSFFFLDSTSMGVYLSVSLGRRTQPVRLLVCLLRCRFRTTPWTRPRTADTNPASHRSPFFQERTVRFVPIVRSAVPARTVSALAINSTVKPLKFSSQGAFRTNCGDFPILKLTIHLFINRERKSQLGEKPSHSQGK